MTDFPAGSSLLSSQETQRHHKRATSELSTILGDDFTAG
jgi:hypothetical protein